MNDQETNLMKREKPVPFVNLEQSSVSAACTTMFPGYSTLEFQGNTRGLFCKACAIFE